MGHRSIGRAAGGVGMAALLAAGGFGIGAGMGTGTGHAAGVKPSFTPGYFRVVSLQGTTLNVTNEAGQALAVSITPTTSLRHRFGGVFKDLGEIQTHDRVQLAYNSTGQGTATAYLVQDYSLQGAGTEVQGTVIRVAANHTRFVLTLTAAYGGKGAAFKVGEKIVVDTTNPASVPVTYMQGGPTCGNASCMVTGLTLELYGLSDRPHHLIEQPKAISQVAIGAPQLVHAATDSSAG